MSDAERDNTIDKVCQEDLIKFGMIPEFVGRLQTIAVLHKLDEPSMIKILKEPKDSLIKQYQELLNVDGVKLVFDDDAVKKIAQAVIGLTEDTLDACDKAIKQLSKKHFAKNRVSSVCMMRKNVEARMKKTGLNFKF